MISLPATFNQNSSGDRAFGTNLTAGTYFIWTYRQEPGNSTDYTMRLDVYRDTTPPTGTLDATDEKTAVAAVSRLRNRLCGRSFPRQRFGRIRGRREHPRELDNGADFTLVYYPDVSLNPAFPQTAPTFRSFYRFFAFNNPTGWTANDNGLYTISPHVSTGTEPPRCTMQRETQFP